jgi:hypothetical protein
MTKEEKQKYNKAYQESNAVKLKEYREANKDNKRLQNKEYREANKDKIKEYREANREYQKGYREANKDYQKEYYEANKDKILAYKKKYCEANKVKIKDYKKAYRESNADKLTYQQKEYCKNRRATDYLFKIKGNIRTLIANGMRNKGYKKTSRTAEILGCSFEEFKVHIEQQFPRDMTWDNAGLWHYDHIKPLASASNLEELLELNHYTNFQPLWGEDNLEKSDNPNWIKCPIKYAK